MRKPLLIAGGLVLTALVLGVVGLVLRAVRWLLILAAIVFLVGAVTGALGKSRSE